MLMNQIIEQIEKIKQINSNNNLVIFVGAGVSRNSGVCSWWELVKEIAEKIGENKCVSCEVKDLICGECGEQIELCSIDGYNCKLKYNFSAEDFLRIPQHFYESFGDSEEEKKPYYQFLKDKFCMEEYETNIIDEIIIKLQPEHIITTNYDHLLENVKDPGVSKYAIITKDDDILSKKGRNYIIKMHGDVNDIENIVLKEEDYLNYSQKHIIIETFIKALLIDKTFLFVGYSLNDNNLKLIMSYIDFFVKEKGVENRQPHYLVVDQIKDPVHDIPYWKHKGVELVDLSKITDYMIKNSNCIKLSNLTGKKLYTFLNYLNNEALAYTDDKLQFLNTALEKFKDDVSCFKFISYKTIMETFRFKSVYGIKAPVMVFADEEEYNNFKILTRNKDLCDLLMKSGICGIQLDDGFKRDRIIFEKEIQEQDSLFELSLHNKYHEIMGKIEKEPSNSEKAYYYSLINKLNGLSDIMNDLKKQYESVDYRKFTNRDYYELAIFEFNNTCVRSLSYIKNDKAIYERLNLLLDSAAARYSKAYKTIKDITNKNADIQEMNDLLLTHEEYYMKKSSMIKMGGTIYGGLFRIRQIAYDYYFFYKKNHLMLDWFNNVEKMVTPYIKAIFCTYYPDEFQAEKKGIFPRTHVEPYPMELVDVDMIVKHVKLKNLRSIISYYKVDTIELSDEIDISVLFEDFCLSMKEYWNISMIDQLESFSFLLSLCKLRKEQNIKIVKAFVSLLTPSENQTIRTVTNNINALWIYVEKHFDKTIKDYVDLLDLLVNSKIPQEATAHPSAYPNLIKNLSEIADKNIYVQCCDEIDRIEDNRQKTYFVFVNRIILLKYGKKRWKIWIKENLSNNMEYEIFQLLYEKVLIFDEKIKDYYENQFQEYAKNSIAGVHTFPDSKVDAIDNLIILLLVGCVNEADLDFMRDYTHMSDYLEFIFNPKSFDYRKIKISDYMWCNFINNEKYRNRILEHRNEFWNKDEEKRIVLGFGTPLENRVAYKYLFD